MPLKDVTSTSFGLLIGFLLPGIVALFSLSFWFASAAEAFHTFLTAKSNIGLFLFLILGALTFGLVVSVVRWFIYEVLLARPRWGIGTKLGGEEWKRMVENDRLIAYRAAIDETYRYHQFFGGLTIAMPALFVGWLNDFELGRTPEGLLILGFSALELLMAAAAITAYRSYLGYARAILADRHSPKDADRETPREGNT